MRTASAPQGRGFLSMRPAGRPAPPLPSRAPSPRAAARRPVSVARRQAGVLAVLVGGALCVDLVVAGALSAEVFGKGWAWPSPSHFAAVLLSALAHPAHPRQGWPAQLARRLPGAGPFWAVFAVVAGAQALAVLGVVRRLVNPGPRPAPRAPPAPRSWVATGRRRPLTDQRSRFGFASAAQLRQEASITAARRRAPQTRPSLAGRGQRPAPNDVGYPLGYAVPGGMALWPSWEASLRLVAPPGEGKTFRALVPILRQHPGPALATSTKADLYELSAVARGRLGPVFALDPDSLVPGADRARWSPVAGCERSETAERRAAALLAATGDDGDVQNGAFFRDSARDLLKAYLHAAAVADLDIRAVLDWSRRPEDTTPTDILVSSPGAAPGWGDLVELHTTGAAETTSGVLRYVARALACLSHDAVVADCCPGPGRELDIEQLLGANGTLYLMGKGSRLGAIAPLITALADEVFDCAERMAARSPARRLDPPLLGLLDEAPSIAPVPGLPELLADGRGRGIVLVYAMQSFSQAVTRWGAQKAETMGNATSITAVLGGLTSPNDLSDLERICGQRPRPARVHPPGGERERRPRFLPHHQLGKRNRLAAPTRIRTLPAGRALVLWSRLPPVLVRMPLLSSAPTGLRSKPRSSPPASQTTRPTPLPSPYRPPPRKQPQMSTCPPPYRPFLGAPPPHFVDRADAEQIGVPGSVATSLAACLAGPGDPRFHQLVVGAPELGKTAQARAVGRLVAGRLGWVVSFHRCGRKERAMGDVADQALAGIQRLCSPEAPRAAAPATDGGALPWPHIDQATRQDGAWPPCHSCEGCCRPGGSRHGRSSGSSSPWRARSLNACPGA